MSSRTFKWVIAGAIAAFLLILVASCHQQPVYAQQGGYVQQPQVVGVAPVGQAPVIVQQPVVVQGGHDGFFTGMMMGHFMSGGFGGSTHTTTIVHAPAPVVPAYRAPAPVYRPAPINTVPRPSFTTNSRGVSTSISRSSGISVRSGRR